MSHEPREDRQGAWWHLFNRGIAKRPVYGIPQEVARFFALIGAAVAAGLLEVHAFSVLTTHFHILARSPRGEIFAAMQHAGNANWRAWRGMSREPTLRSVVSSGSRASARARPRAS